MCACGTDDENAAGYAFYIKEQLHGLTGFLVPFSMARTASWNTSSRLSLFMAEHSMNCLALILLRIRLPSAVVMNFSECGTRRSLLVPVFLKLILILRWKRKRVSEKANIGSLMIETCLTAVEILHVNFS